MFCWLGDVYKRQVASQVSPVVSFVFTATFDKSVRLNCIGNSSVDFTTYNSAGAAADTGDRIGFSVSGTLEY